MATSKIELAKETYAKHNGVKQPFIADMMAAGMTKTGATTYFANCQQAELARLRATTPPNPQPKSYLQEAVEAAYKRTIIVIMEIEVDELEDTQQTAELAVELLQGDMDNQIKLIAAAEKQ